MNYVLDFSDLQQYSGMLLKGIAITLGLTAFRNRNLTTTGSPSSRFRRIILPFAGRQADEKMRQLRLNQPLCKTVQKDGVSRDTDLAKSFLDQIANFLVYAGIDERITYKGRQINRSDSA